MYFKEKRKWQIPPEPIGEEQIEFTDEADIVIVGAGYAGIFAAKTAMEAGARVILLEKCTRNGRIYNFSGGSEYAVFNSKYLHEVHKVPMYKTEDFILEFEKRTLNRCNTTLISQIAHNSGETFDWFIESLPQGFRDHLSIWSWPFRPTKFNGQNNGFKSFVGTTYWDKIAPGGLNKTHERKFNLPYACIWTTDQLEEQGLKVYYRCDAQQLQKENGRITGVYATLPREEQGLETKMCLFKAKTAVLLATGDFSRDVDMVCDLCDEVAELTENGEGPKFMLGGRDGRGQKMGVWAGGRMEYAPRGCMYTPNSGANGCIGGNPFLRLNEAGKRYVNEGFAGQLIAGVRGPRQPGKWLFNIWDSDWENQLEYQSYDHGNSYYYAFPPDNPYGPASYHETMDNAVENMRRRKQGLEPIGIYDELMKKEVPNNVVAAETLEELADVLGFAGEYKENFLRSIARYNEICRQGYDDDFAKDPQYLWELKNPPYFGAKGAKKAGWPMVTTSGLMCDDELRVLDGDGWPIPGLYAAGLCTGEIFPNQYCPPMGGCGIGTATVLGRLAGKYMTKKL